MNARARIATSVAVAGALVTGAAAAVAEHGKQGATRFSAALSGYEEVPASISTSASGRFTARVTGAGDIRYTLRYTGIEGGDVQQAHVHFGQRHVAGGVSAFLCSNLPDPPAGTPACPLGGGTVRGLIEPQDVVGPDAQGIAPGEFDELLRAMRAGATYANVHSEKYRAGELRGQVKPRR